LLDFNDTRAHTSRQAAQNRSSICWRGNTWRESRGWRAAAERIRQRLDQTAGKEKSIELKFSIPDVWSRQLFIALCRRYGLRPYRHPRMHRQSIMIKAPQSFMEQVLWPEFQELNAAAYLSVITEKVIREEVHRETGDAEEVAEPTRIGR
jgi:hypothetical protein